MQLRGATPKDFEVYRTLWENMDLSVIYNPKKSDVKPRTETGKIQDLFDEETLKQLEEAFKRTPEKFEKELAAPMEYRIYLIEDNGKIIGFVELYNSGIPRWKLAEFNIQRRYQSQKNVTEVTDILLKQSHIKVIDVCIPPYVSCKKRFENAGFSSIGGGFFRKKREQKS